MNCKNCNNPLSDDAKFCGKCGTNVLIEKTIINKTPLSGGRITKKIFQIIAVLLLLVSLSAMSSFSIDDPQGWLSTIYDIFNITSVIAFIAIVTNGWRYRKSGTKNKEWFGWRWIVFLIVISLIGLGTAIFSQAITISREKALQNPDNRIEYANTIVQAVKEKTVLPKKIDDSTTITDITAENNAIRYHYLLSDVDTSELSNESLKGSLISSICQSGDTNDLFEQGINIEFLYKIENSSQNYLVKFTKADCQ